MGKESDGSSGGSCSPSTETHIPAFWRLASYCARVRRPGGEGPHGVSSDSGVEKDGGDSSDGLHGHLQNVIGVQGEGQRMFGTSVPGAPNHHVQQSPLDDLEGSHRVTTASTTPTTVGVIENASGDCAGAGGCTPLATPYLRMTVLLARQIRLPFPTSTRGSRSIHSALCHCLQPGVLNIRRTAPQRNSWYI